jgi:hypothetical protein
MARADEAAHKATVDLVHTILPADSYSTMIDQMTDQMTASLAQRGAAPSAELVSRLKKVVKECVPYEEMVLWTADVYASRFSVNEIQDLATFYKTPTGRKASKLLPQIMGETGKKMGEVMMTRMPAAMQKYGLNPDGTLSDKPAKGKK